MALQEIERKFLVRGDFKTYAASHVQIVQGYLSSVPERTVRVRIYGDKGFLTIKGIATNDGLTRFEWEKEIDKAEAEELIKLCESGVIDKVRYLVPFEGHIFEVDEFDGENKGLIVAELELSDENEEYVRPDWLGEEVTGQKPYYNASLIKYPYSKWS